VDAPVDDRRRCTRAIASHHVVEANPIGVRPFQLAGFEVVARDKFVLAALLLSKGLFADDREPRPAGAHRLRPPDRLWRMSSPVGGQSDAINSRMPSAA